MTISELIRELQAIQQQHGDIVVETWDDEGYRVTPTLDVDSDYVGWCTEEQYTYVTIG